MADGEKVDESIAGEPWRQRLRVQRNGLPRLAALNGPRWGMAGDGAGGLGRAASVQPWALP